MSALQSCLIHQVYQVFVDPKIPGTNACFHAVIFSWRFAGPAVADVTGCRVAGGRRSHCWFDGMAALLAAALPLLPAYVPK